MISALCVMSFWRERLIQAGQTRVRFHLTDGKFGRWRPKRGVNVSLWWKSAPSMPLGHADTLTQWRGKTSRLQTPMTSLLFASLCSHVGTKDGEGFLVCECRGGRATYRQLTYHSKVRGYFRSLKRHGLEVWNKRKNLFALVVWLEVSLNTVVLNIFGWGTPEMPWPRTQYKLLLWPLQWS